MRQRGVCLYVLFCFVFALATERMVFSFTDLYGKSGCLVWGHAKFMMSIRKISAGIKSTVAVQIWSLGERPPAAPAAQHRHMAGI